MNYSVTIILILTLLSTSSGQFIIKSVRFKPGTALFDTNRDGTVLVTLNTDEETSICNFNFDQVDAGIVCKTLGYPAKGYSLMTSSSTVTGPVLIGDFQCTGSEESLRNCLHSGRKVFGSKCGEHKRDVHVFCLEQKIVPPTPTVKTTCTEKANRLKISSPVGLKNTGFLQIYHNSAYHYVCDDAGLLTVAVAEHYCKEICTNPVNPQIILPVSSIIPESLKYVVLNTKDSNFPVLSVKDTCRTFFVAGIQCGDENVVPESSPNVTCTQKLMFVSWNKDHKPEINTDLITISSECNSTNSFNMTSDADLAVSISIDLSKIGIIESNAINIIYICNLMRRYVSGEKSEKNIRVQCTLPKESNNSATIGFQKATPYSILGEFAIQSVMELFTDNKFTNMLSIPYKIENDNFLYVKVTLKSPPDDVRLVLRKCYIADTNDTATSKKENLIDIGCAQKPYDVSIYPLTRVDEGFRFRPNGISTKFGKNQLYIVCEGLKCLSPSESGCKFCGEAKRRKRSLDDFSQYSEVPIAYHPINFV